MGSSLLRPLSVGEILDGAFSVYRNKFATLVGTCLVVVLPVAVLFFVHPMLGSLGQLAATVLLPIAMVWSVSESLLGREVTVGQALGTSLRKALPFVLVILLYTIPLTIGFMLLLVPGIILWLMWFAYLPVFVIEGKIAFFGRSRELARGSWGKVFLVQFLTGIILALPAMLVGGSAFAFGQISVADGTMPPLFNALSILITALTAPYSAATLTLLYYDQRVRKEGLDIELSTASLRDAATA